MNTYNLQNIYTAGTVLNATRNSVAIQLQDMVDFSIQIFFTGTPTGSFKLQASNDPVPPKTLQPGVNGAITFSPTHWSDIADSGFSVVAAGDVMWNYRDAGFTFVRVVYTDSSSGASTAVIASAEYNGKGA